MNDYCGLSSSATRATAKLRRQTERATRREGYVWDVHQVRASSRRYSVDSNRHDVRSSSQHQVTRAHVARDYTRFDGPAGLPTSHAFVSAGFGCDEKTQKTRRGQTRRRRRARARNRPKSESHRPCETCPSRLKVVNTKVQLRHLIIGHIIFIHERRTAAGEPRGRGDGLGGCAPVQSPVGWNARGVDGEDRGCAGETAFDRRSAARDRGSARGDGEVRGQRRRRHPHSGMWPGWARARGEVRGGRDRGSVGCIVSSTDGDRLQTRGVRKTVNKVIIASSSPKNPRRARARATWGGRRRRT